MRGWFYISVTQFRRHSLPLALAILFGVNALIWAALARAESPLLYVYFLDVGQGDAIFIEAPGGGQMLIDGGPDGAVLRELGKVMPYYDRTIDVVLATHPDKDHIAGLIPVIERYDVDYIVDTGATSDTSYSAAYQAVSASEPANYVRARRGMVIDLGGGAYFEVLFPDRELPGLSDANTGSIVGILHFGANAFMLSGDSPRSIEEYLVSLDGAHLQSDVLKAGHHGSRTSSSEAFIQAVHPAFAIISAGKDNTYGHPHAEVIERLEAAEAETVSTIDKGTITFVADGTTVRLDD